MRYPSAKARWPKSLTTLTATLRDRPDRRAARARTRWLKAIRRKSRRATRRDRLSSAIAPIRTLLTRSRTNPGPDLPPEQGIPSAPPTPTSPLRTLFLSDLHLGASGARADLLLDFLATHRAERYYLVGDVLDGWQVERNGWGRAERQVIDHLDRRRAEGAEVIYVGGNHDPHPDAWPRQCGLDRPLLASAVHEAADGRRYLVTHGDDADYRPFGNERLQRLGAAIDERLRRLDLAVATLVHGLGIGAGRGVMPVLVGALNSALYPRRGFERRLVEEARTRGLDGVICGHFHLPALHTRHAATYANCGDWLDSFAALAEDHDGQLSLLRAEPVAARSSWRRPRLAALRGILSP